MDAAQALADLTEISSQVEAAVLFDETGEVAGSTLPGEQDAAALARATRASHFHGSLRRSEGSRMQHESQWVLEDVDQSDGTSRFVVDADDVRAMIGSLRSS